MDTEGAMRGTGRVDGRGTPVPPVSSDPYVQPAVGDVFGFFQPKPALSHL